MARLHQLRLRLRLRLGLMLRRAGLLFLCAPLAISCGLFPELQNPGPSVTLWGAMMAMGGEMKMESPGNPPQQNPFADVSADLGLDDRDFGIGGTLAWGDGFGGIELSYFGWKTAMPSVFPRSEVDFGKIQAGFNLETKAELDNISLQWIQTLVRTHELAENLTVRLGAGISVDHNEYQINIQQRQGILYTQTLSMRDDYGIPMLQLRGEADFRPFKLRLDFGYSQGKFGDFNGEFFDIAATGWWKAQKGIELFAGLWFYRLPTSGVDLGLAYELNTNISGFKFGIQFDF